MTLVQLNTKAKPCTWSSSKHTQKSHLCVDQEQTPILQLQGRLLFHSCVPTSMASKGYICCKAVSNGSEQLLLLSVTPPQPTTRELLTS